MVYSIQDLLYQFDSIGVYDYLLPFLLIFAIVFGMLTYLNIFGKNKGVHVIIAFVVGMLAVNVRWGYDFTRFYAEIFPRLGIGITVILAILILVGFFVTEDDRRYWLWGLGAIGFIIAIIVIVKTFGYLGWDNGYYWSGDMVGWVIGAVLLVGLIIAIAASSGGNDGEGKGKGKGKASQVAVISPWTK